MSLRHFLFSVTVLLVSVGTAADDTFKPHDADEAHAWRLYQQYKECNQKIASLQSGIAKKLDDIRSVAYGMGGIRAVDQNDTAALGRMRNQLASEKDRQQRLEKVWDKKFWGRYGKLQDSSQTIYDPVTKRTMDRTEYRLRHFRYATTKPTPRPKAPSIAPRFSVNGTYSSTWGNMVLRQSGAAVTGTYTHDQGHISGSLRGNVLTGTWTEAPSRRPPNDAGDVKLTFSKDGRSFNGSYRYGSSGPMTGGWTGSRR